MTSNKEFQELALATVKKYAEEHLDTTDNYTLKDDDVYIVWLVKALQNFKALVSTNLHDGMYYEVTYNGDKQELYLDAYKKFENRVFKV